MLKNSVWILAVGMVALSSCKKEEPEMRDEKIGGCTDENSPLYNGSADFDDQSCVYAYVNAYEITYHPQKDESGDDWDLLVNTDADIYLKIKPEGASDWMFESAVVDNQAHDEPVSWTAPENIKLLNQDYVWEVYDSDGTSADDFVASGTFNPIELASNGTITTTGTNSSGNETQLVLTYELDE
ncbi:hypothetical protein CRYO30217_02668 [Parvicella tangerina]|uniref:Uncharacterized protein n=2 Tax=Parvicella tangerina TaxID=2829795 RepID=A0A916NIX8_9FLAO|nr:hypothetical protein CRYO30217_02668 [Parvicella tangerina]